MKQEGYVLVDGHRLPFMGEVNDVSLQEWTEACERQAVRNYIADHDGREPESVEQAMDYQHQVIQELEARHPSTEISTPLPVRRGHTEIIYFQ